MSKFVVVRFAPGSGGKFISTLLQLSPDVNAWESELDRIKQIENPRIALDYFKTKFNYDFDHWLKMEPEIPYEMQWVSNRFDRGDEITHTEAMEFLRNDTVFWDHYLNPKKIILISNKSRMPDWYPDATTVVNVLIDSVWATKWAHRARLQKQFLRTGQDCWIVKQNHPDYCSEKRAALARKFQTENFVTFQGKPYAFLKKFIVNDPLTMIFQNKELILNDISNNRHSQQFWRLSSFKTSFGVKKELKKICKTCNITMPSDEILLPLVDWYLGLHHQLYKKKNLIN